jgi:16S rRNA (uracil1498-N3)-methyltransferase
MSLQKQAWTLIVPNHSLEEQGIIILSGDEHHYVANVLRLQNASVVHLTNCNGIKAVGKIQEINKKSTEIQIEQIEKFEIQTPKINLWLAMPKPSTLEEVVATASELGVNEIHIFKSEKCAFKSELKKDKLQRISDEAVRISKSAFSAKIFEHKDLKSLMSSSSEVLSSSSEVLSSRGLTAGSIPIFFCDEAHIYENKITNSIFDMTKEKMNSHVKIMNILVGPEASFSDQERVFILEQDNVIPVSLGKNILRVPTAVTVAVGVLKTHQT